MKLRHFYPCLLLAGMAVTMASCSDEATLTSGQGRNVTMAVNINRVGDNTRSILTEKEGNLKCTWETGDLILVVDNSGNKLGVLNLTSGDGEESATFTGEITTDISGETNMSFLYLGDKTEAELKELSSPVTIDYSKQDGSIGWLSSNDFFCGSTKVNIASSYVNVKDVELVRPVAFGKFEIQLPEDVNYGGEEITISGIGIYTQATVSSTGTCTFSNSDDTEAKITVKPDSDDDGNYSNIFYLTLLPKSDEQITPMFSVTIDDIEYEGSLGSRTWNASEFVRQQNADGTTSGVPITLQSEEIIVDHSKNPLAKWAESDLYSLGWGSEATGRFTTNYMTAGQFFQFGRNHGYDSYIKANGYDRFLVAKLNKNWTAGLFDTVEFGEVNGNVEDLMFVYKGTGKNQTYRWYESDDRAIEFPEYFLVAGNSSLQNWQGETVFNTSIQHKHTWAQRAVYFGYIADLCPEKYKLPTLDDWKKILPSGGHIYSTGTTNSFEDFSEIKKDGNIKYAVRWSHVKRREGQNPNVQYLKIDALVIGADVKTAEDIDWSDENIVTRYFKAAGMISPYFSLEKIEKNTGEESYQWVTYAVPQGTFKSELLSNNIVKVSIDRDDSWLSGYYWVDDPNQYYMEFRFDAENLQQQGSYIKFIQPEVPIACNIRCILK